jgi:alpha-galactosidase
MVWCILLLLGALVVPGEALQNGAALTPPMSWLSWQRYRCAIGCNDSTSKDCFNERLIRETADALVSEGYKDAGYEYVCLVSPNSVSVRAQTERFEI